MKEFPFINSRQSLVLLRMAVAIMFVLHGITQLRLSSLGNIGLTNNPAPVIGSFINTLLAIFEITGGVLLALGYFIPLITLLFIIEILLWIILYSMNGWYAPGYQGGMWYSLLLIVCLVVIAAAKKK